MTLPDIIQTLGGSVERAPWGWVLTAAVLVALIKVWPLLSSQAIDAMAQRRKERLELEAALRKEKRDDLGDCQERLNAMDKRLTETEERAHSFELRLLGTLTAYRILEVEVEKADPLSSALAQARAVLKETFRISPVLPPDMGGELAKMN